MSPDEQRARAEAQLEVAKLRLAERAHAVAVAMDECKRRLTFATSTAEVAAAVIEGHRFLAENTEGFAQLVEAVQPWVESSD